MTAGPCSVQSFDLLLRLLEAHETTYTNSTLVDYHGAPGEELIRSGLVHAAGFGRTVAADDGERDEPFAVERDHRRGELGYHHPLSGWTGVVQSSLQNYEADVAAIAKTLLGAELRFPGGVVVRKALRRTSVRPSVL